MSGERMLSTRGGRLIVAAAWSLTGLDAREMDRPAGAYHATTTSSSTSARMPVAHCTTSIRGARGHR